MSQVLTLVSSSPAGKGRNGIYHISDAWTTETYTNGTGADIDIASLDLPWNNAGPAAEILRVTAQSNGGHTARITKSPTASQPQKLTVRLFNGTTELSTTTYTLTLDLQVHTGLNLT